MGIWVNWKWVRIKEGREFGKGEAPAYYVSQAAREYSLSSIAKHATWTSSVEPNQRGDRVKEGNAVNGGSQGRDV